MFTLFWIVFQGDTKGSHVKHEKQRHRTSSTSHSSLFFLGPSSKKSETRKWPRARRERPSFSRLTASPLDARGACTPLTKSEEKERLLAVYHTHSGWLNIYFRVCGSYVITLHLSVAQKLSDKWRSTFAPLTKSRRNQYGFSAGVRAVRKGGE